MVQFLDTVNYFPMLLNNNKKKKKVETNSINSTEPAAVSWLTTIFSKVFLHRSTQCLLLGERAEERSYLWPERDVEGYFLSKIYSTVSKHTANRKYYQKFTGGKRAVTLTKTLVFSRSFKALPAQMNKGY